jgi:hypothetical protein
MKVNSTVYKGIEFIEISSLPSDQKASLLQTINPDLLIKILIDGKLMPRCLQYKVYEDWYDNEYRPMSRRESNSIPENSETEIKANIQI